MEFGLFLCVDRLLRRCLLAGEARRARRGSRRRGQRLKMRGRRAGGRGPWAVESAVCLRAPLICDIQDRTTTPLARGEASCSARSDLSRTPFITLTSGPPPSLCRRRRRRRVVCMRHHHSASSCTCALLT